MKLTIAICDDNIHHLNVIEGYLESFDAEYDTHLIKAYNGETLLEKIEGDSVDIAFLDIEMEGLNGIQVGNAIRNKFPKSIIVFITGFRGYALEAFDVESFQYIIKPINFKKFCALMEKILIRLKESAAYEEKNNVFLIKDKKQIVKIKYSEIYFFERQGKRILVQTDKESFLFLDSLQKIMNRLKGDFFVRCHHGFIVNVDKILHIKDDLILLRKINKAIPISRRYRREVINALSRGLFKD